MELAPPLAGDRRVVHRHDRPVRHQPGDGRDPCDDPNGNPNQAQTESAKAYAVFDAEGSGTPSEDVSLVIAHPSLHVTDPAFQTFVAATVARLKGLTVSDGGATVPAFDKIGSADRHAAGGPRLAGWLGRPDRRDDQR